MDRRVPAPRADGGLLGRAVECALLDGVLADIRRGESRSLVVRGEAGIGKTALLDWMVESAADLTVVRATGVESEMELAYASLHQLCIPLLDRLDLLPAPQRTVLEIVFGLGSGDAPDRFLVGLGSLSLLSEVAEERPLLCVVDDAQWLDQASELTLAFVARRLLAEPVGMVFAAREPGEQLRSLPALEVRGLGADDADALLRSVVRSKLDQRVRKRIAAETRGNPLALLELPHGLGADRLAGEFGLLETEDLSGRIEEGFVRRIEPLPEEARLLLVIAAAEPVGDPLLLWRAAEKLGIGEAAVEAANSAEVVAIGERVIFRHPLVRSAVYRSATVQERRLAHLALSEVTDPAVDPDRRAWHLAGATAGPDEEVALELERSAGRAQTRGGQAAAAAFLQRAVALTQDPRRRAERAVDAADATFKAGAFDTASGFLETADAGPLDAYQRARIDLLRGHVAFALNRGGDAPPLLLQAARRLESFDLDLAREAYLNAWGAAVFADGKMLSEICQAVRMLPPPRGDPRPSDLLLDGLASLTMDGRAAAAPILRAAAKALTDMPAEDLLRLGWLAGTASSAVWDHEGYGAVAARQVELAREAGALAELPIYLSELALVTSWMGEFVDTASLIAEIDAVTSVTGIPFTPFASVWLLSLQGAEPEVPVALADAMKLAAAGGEVTAAMGADWAAAVLYNGLARFEEAASAAKRGALSYTYNPWWMWALPELVEGAARSGDAELAGDALERLAVTTQPAGTDWALGIEARCRALLTTDETAEGLYQEAIARLGRTVLRPELARAELLYGEWLRRANRRVDARNQLRAAYQQFSSIGMEAFAERARRELQATGEKVRKRMLETRDELTAQERQVALLARDGLTNPDIGARLFLSPRTVEYHLSKVFSKLGITSRRELGKVLPSSESGLATA
jgi:DNA-binding CsgD family transcriptional regulator